MWPDWKIGHHTGCHDHNVKKKRAPKGGGLKSYETGGSAATYRPEVNVIVKIVTGGGRGEHFQGRSRIASADQ